MCFYPRTDCCYHPCQDSFSCIKVKSLYLYTLLCRVRPDPTSTKNDVLEEFLSNASTSLLGLCFTVIKCVKLSQLCTGSHQDEMKNLHNDTKIFSLHQSSSLCLAKGVACFNVPLIVTTATKPILTLTDFHYVHNVNSMWSLCILLLRVSNLCGWSLPVPPLHQDPRW